MAARWFFEIRPQPTIPRRIFRPEIASGEDSPKVWVEIMVVLENLFKSARALQLLGEYLSDRPNGYRG
jgi:hypothetical protein